MNKKHTFNLFFDLIRDKGLLKTIATENIESPAEFKRYLEHLSYELFGNIRGYQLGKRRYRPYQWDKIDFNLLYPFFVNEKGELNGKNKR